jgi:hypothetical protein
LTVLLLQQEQEQHQQNELSSSSPNMRCFAYAAPPVFASLGLASKARKVTTNFVHENDAVPFLSFHSVRGLLLSLREVQEYATKHMSRTHKWQVAFGLQPPPEALVDAVRNLPFIQPKRGAPCLGIPAAQTLWLREKRENGQDYYDYEIWDQEIFPTSIRVHQDMFVDHYPPRYEHALNHMHSDIILMDHYDDKD